MNTEIVKGFISSQMEPTGIAYVCIFISLIILVSSVICMKKDNYDVAWVLIIIGIVMAVVCGGIAFYESHNYSSFYNEGHEIKYELTDEQCVSLMSGISSIHSDSKESKEGITFSFTENRIEKKFNKVLLPENSVTIKGDTNEIVVKEYDSIKKPLMQKIPEKVFVLEKVQLKK